MNRRDLFQRALALLGLGAIAKAKPADPIELYAPGLESDFERYMRIKREMERSALAYERKLVDEYLRSDDPPPIVR